MRSGEQWREASRQALSRYDLGLVTDVRRLEGGSSNANFLVRSEAGDFVWRMFQGHALSDIEDEIAVLRMLEAEEFPASVPVAAKDDRYVCSGPYGYSVLLRYIGGEEPSLSADTAAAVGLALAQLNSLTPPPGFERPDLIDIAWCERLAEALDKVPQAPAETTRWYRVELDRLAHEWPKSRLPKGLIHGDAFPDNTVFRRGRLVALIDFEDSSVDNLVYEVAMAANGFCFPDNRLDTALLDALMGSYERLRPMTTDEHLALPYFLNWAAFRMASWHLSLMVERPEDFNEARAGELIERLQGLRSDPL